MADDNPVFRALGDATRRRLLDLLRERDGQSVGELAERFASSRYAVMKHLNILAEAGLVVRRKDGRQTRNYLNPVPIRQIHDRWISRYAEPWVGALTDLKRSFEEQDMAETLEHLYELYIRASPEQIWEAITSGDVTRRYFHETRIESDWSVGSRVIYYNPDESVAVDGEVRACEPPRLLEYTWNVHYDPERAGEQPSIVRWELEAMGEQCRLTLVHRFDEECKTYREVKSGWNAILSSMKSLLETGEPLSVA